MKTTPMKKSLQNAKVAIVSDWLTNMGGAEKVIHNLHQQFPDAPIYTTLYDPKRMKGFENADIRTSFLQKIPMAQKKHPLFLNWMPMAIESFNLNEFDIVISSSHSVAKGIITKPETLHVSYCHTPMRYAWEHWELDYRLQKVPTFLHNNIKKKIHKLRIWDRLTADRVDHFLVNSSFVAKRVNKYYRKPSTVLHPPVETEGLSTAAAQDFYLMVGRQIGYKRFDLVIKTFNGTSRKLIIAGTGPETSKLKAMAKDNIQFLGRVDDNKLKELYRTCKALIFPQLEDFGITPVECMASGRPVIAFGQGGARDTISEGETGVFFEEQSEKSLSKVLDDFETKSWDSQKIQQLSQKFSEQSFKIKLQEFLTTAYEKHQS